MVAGAAAGTGIDSVAAVSVLLGVPQRGQNRSSFASDRPQFAQFDADMLATGSD
jgi:hypothetical protein